tara:strand:+ start:2373 stop:2906 length:534 start_codon:yes stop_codon:yes gene_type:complete
MAYNNPNEQGNNTGMFPMFGQQPGSAGSFNWADAANPNQQTTMAQNQLQDFSRMGMGNPGYGGYGSKDANGNLLNGGSGKLGQDSKMGWFGEGGKAATGIAGVQALGGLYMANEARKLGAADLDFRQQSFNDQYASQRSLVNDQLYDRQRRRNLESGMGTDAAGTAADDYVKNRGVA